MTELIFYDEVIKWEKYIKQKESYFEIEITNYESLDVLKSHLLLCFSYFEFDYIVLCLNWKELFLFSHKQKKNWIEINYLEFNESTWKYKTKVFEEAVSLLKKIIVSKEDWKFKKVKRDTTEKQLIRLTKQNKKKLEDTKETYETSINEIVNSLIETNL